MARRRRWVVVVLVLLLLASWVAAWALVERERGRRHRAVATLRANLLEQEGFVMAERATSAALRRQVGDLAASLDAADAQPDIGVTTVTERVYVNVPVAADCPDPMATVVTEAFDSPCPQECVEACMYDGADWVCPRTATGEIDRPPSEVCRVGVSGRLALAATLGDDGALWFGGNHWVTVYNESTDWEREVQLAVAEQEAAVSKRLEAALRRGVDPRSWAMSAGISTDSAVQVRLTRHASRRWGWYVGADWVLAPESKSYTGYDYDQGYQSWNWEQSRFRGSGGVSFRWGL